MASGSVVKDEGRRGTTWRVKYTDASGSQIMETLGKAADGWTKRKAEAELRERLVRVEKKDWRKPAPLTFGEYSATWYAEGKRAGKWKPKTVTQYRSVLRRLGETFGTMPVAAIRPRDVSAYIAAASELAAPATVGRDLDVLFTIFRCAQREELVESNAAEAAERPKVK